MNRLIILTVFLLSSILTFSQSSCLRTYELNSKSICIPKFDELAECYSNEFFSLYADMLRGTKDEIILAFYMSKSDSINFLSNVLSEQIVLNDLYCKIYSSETSNNFNVRDSDLDLVLEASINIMQQVDTTKFFTDSMNSVLAESNIVFHRPLLLDHYKLQDNIRTILSILIFSENNSISKMTVSMHLIAVKNRLIFIATYEQFKDFNSLKKLEEKSNSFAKQFLNNNL